MKKTRQLVSCWNYLMNIIFPKKCLGCQTEGTFFCEKCLSKIKLIDQTLCPYCKSKTTQNGQTCSKCKKETGVTEILICANYGEKALAKAIKTFKYQFVKELSLPLSKLAIKKLRKSSMPIPDLIIPVPLHPRRLRFRGFNQSELIAYQISNNLLPFTKIQVSSFSVARIKFTKPQVKASDAINRRKNLAGAFLANHQLKDQVIGKHLLLVDDVLTTGSTISEIAKELKKLNPRKISVIVLARQN